MIKITMILAFLVIIMVPSVLHFSFKMQGKKMKYVLLADMACFALMCVASTIIFANGDLVFAAGETVQAGSSKGLGYIAAALATGLGCLGAGIAVAPSASAAIGAISEDPKVMGKALIFVALAEGIALYGLLIAFTIIGSL